MELKFSKLESYQDFLRNPENLGGKRGAYVWGFRFFNTRRKITSIFIPYYVGRDKSDIHRRMREHFDGIRYDTHKILKSKLLLNNKNWEDDWFNCRSQHFENEEHENCAYLHKSDDDGWIGSKKQLQQDHPEKYLKLLPHIDTYLDNLYVTYIDIGHLKLNADDEADKVDQLERYIQEIIGLKLLASYEGAKLREDFRPRIEADTDTYHLLRNYPLP